jgi:predicted RecB family nuclease
VAKAKAVTLSIDNARAALRQRVYLARGRETLDIPRADIELDFDMENDPNGLIYMWGSRLEIRSRKVQLDLPSRRTFATFSGEAAEEATTFVEFWKYLQWLIVTADNLGLTFKAYYYSPAELRCMRSLAKRYPDVRGMPTVEEIEEFFESEHAVDLLAIICDQMVWPTESRSLKDTAKYARFMWRDDDPSGANSMVWYDLAVNAEDPDVRALNAQRVISYNEDDCEATFVLREFLSRIQNAQTRTTKIGNVANLAKWFEQSARHPAGRGRPAA